MTAALDLFAEFAVNPTSESEGVWCEYGDVSFLVAMSNNHKFRERFMRLYKPHERLLKTNTPAANKKSAEIMADVMSTTILLDWKGLMVVEKGGQPVAYSTENARKALMMEKFRDLITEFSNDFGLFKAVKDEEDTKN